MKEVLVVGGGPAGLTVAKSLEEKGIRTVLVERSESLGGMAKELTCKGLVECRNCGVCLVSDFADEVLRSRMVEPLLLSEVKSLTRQDGGLVAKIRTSPRYVTDDCIGCGRCVEVCPVVGKAVFPPTGNGLPRSYWIDRSRCQHFKKAKCDKCAEVCPSNAFNYDDRVRNLTRKVSAVVLATGMKAVDACEVSRLGCGVLKDVLSSVDAEKMLNEKGKLLRPSDGAAPRKIAIVQCVGSRSVRAGVEYCSKFCCKYATKIAQLLFDIDPEINLDFYFMDLRTLYEPQDEFKVWAKDRKKQVRLIRSMPATVTQGGEGRLVLRASGETDRDISEEEYDMVILSVGMRPEGGGSDLAKSLGVGSDERGFAIGGPELERDGIFVCGAVASPSDIEETVMRSISLSSRLGGTKEVRE